MSLKNTKPSQTSAGRKAINNTVRDRRHLAPSALVLALSAALAMPGTALATDWVGTTTSWSISGNWSAGVPDSTTNVFINTNTNAAIVSTVGEATGNIVVGDTAAGLLEVSSGGTLSSSDATLGSVAGGDGKVLVTGSTGGFASTWAVTNGIFVGAGGAGTLDIQAGGMVTVGANVVLGLAANSTGIVNVDGTGSNLDIVGTFTVGDGGAGTLTITNDGSVKSGSSTIGNQPGATGAVTVDASAWTSTGNITVGGSGTGTLDILAGGVVTNVNGTVGGGGGGQGTVTVDGNGSTWTNTGTLAVGTLGAGTLNIQNGGLVTANAVFIGDAGTSGTVNVDGATGASTFTSNGALAVGFTGNGTLNILNGGAVNSNSADVGSQAGSVGAVTIDGTGSIWTNTLQLGVGNAGTGTMLITAGGELVTSGAVVGGAASGVGTVIVNGVGSKWTDTTGVVTIGNAGTGTLNISNGGVVGDSQGVIGAQAGSNGTVTVDGSASFWNNSSNIRIGALGTGSLSITNGGTVSSAGATIGEGASGVGTVTVDNSTWNVTGGNSLFVGFNGNGTLNIVNGGKVNDGNGVIGGFAGSQGTATVSGTGSTWTNSGTLGVGSAGTGTLTISAGGSVTSTMGGEIGSAAGSTGTAIVDGNGSSWGMTTGSLRIGSAGTGSLAVQNGGVVASGGTVILGEVAGGVGTATVSGAGSILSAATALIVGASGTGSLNIMGGGKVNNVLSQIGAGAGANGAAVVDGAGSKWTNTGNVLVGDFGTGALTISNGGVVSDNNGSVGTNAGGSGTVTVTGTGSQWTHAGTLAVGDAGTGTLNIANGGVVSNTDAAIGSQGGSTGTATVDGAGSTWTNSGSLFVGGTGAGSLTISNGGVVNAGIATVIGSNPVGAPGALSVLGGGKLNSNFSFIAGTGSVGSAVVDGTGSSWASIGGLNVGDAGAGTLTVTNGGAVSNDVGVIGNMVNSSGTVLVDGAGSTWTSSNLAVGNSGAGTLTIANGGVVSAAGTVVIANAAGSTGTLNIGGASGALATAPGTLTTPTGIQFGPGSGTINFNHSDTTGNYVFGSNIGGPGTINQVAGWTNLTGDASGFTGQTNVTGGRLAVNGTLGLSQVNVSSSGILGGNGFVGNTFANAGGIIAPGNSIGTLNVSGNITFAAGSIYQVETNATGQSDNLLVSGAATLSGGTVQVIAGNGNYSPTTSYSIMSALNGVTGTFSSVTSDLAFLDPSLNYSGNTVTLTLTRNNTPMGGVGQNPGQTNTGTGVQGLGAGNALYGAVLGLSAPQARYAFQQLSGEVHTSARSVQLEDSRVARDASLERLRALDSDVPANDGGADPEEGKRNARLLPSVRDLAYWARAMGSWGHMDGDAGTATVKRDTAGFVMGADTRFGEEGRFGLMGGYSRSTFDVSDRNSSGSSDNYHLGAYAGNRWGGLALRTGITYSWHDVSTGRVVAFPGFSDRLQADYKAATTQLFAELGYRIKTERADLEPFANLAHVNVSSDSFTERGGLAALTSSGNSSGVTFSTVGLRASSRFALSGGADVTARGSLGWRHTAGNTAPTTTLAFAGGAPFVIAGVPVARNAAVVEAGLDFKLTNAATLGISYGGQFGSGLKDHSARVNLNVVF